MSDIIKISNVQNLQEILKEWILLDSIPEEQVIEVPLYVIRDFRTICYSEQYGDTLIALRNELNERIKRNENSR